MKKIFIIFISLFLVSCTQDATSDKSNKPNSSQYIEKADKRSWQAMKIFFNEIF